MKSILFSIAIAMSAHSAFAEEAKTEQATAPAAAAATADAAKKDVGTAMKAAPGKMQAKMADKHESMMKMCSKMHPGMNCEEMMGKCKEEKDMKHCMDKMATEMKK
jgi:hypothetical protein